MTEEQRKKLAEWRANQNASAVGEYARRHEAHKKATMRLIAISLIFCITNVIAATVNLLFIIEKHASLWSFILALIWNVILFAAGVTYLISRKNKLGVVLGILAIVNGIVLFINGGIAWAVVMFIFGVWILRSLKSLVPPQPPHPELKENTK